ncbi:Dam family site-specific DNA-(adenine-N6)-methyltransferase [Listeria monocytogenes]|nr:Dam family site-specific DNA-(adenine-N6)-methyltransferase [Listeria monocytogenes]
MRYLGNKTRLLTFIESVIDKYNIEGKVFGDLFSGTGSVGDYFKNRFNIISNDFLYYSYVINRAKLENYSIPAFSKFEKNFEINIFDYLNKLSFNPDKNFFVYNNYTPVGDRMFFTESNGAKIDGVRITIEELYKEKWIDESEYFFLLASLLQSVTRYSNTSGTYEAFFKFWDPRAEKEFTLLPLEFEEYEDNIFKHEIYNEDTNDLVRRISGDIAYIDPPYTVTQYVSAYHMLETIAKYDFPEIKGIGGKRGRGNKNSLYARRTVAKEQFEDLLRQLNFKHVLISYSNQALVPLDELIEIAKMFAKDSKVEVEYYQYQEYRNHRSSSKGNGRKLKEVIIYFEKENTLMKSPLNYSGSKDTLLPEILKNLPYSIDTFVDVMGGAFNVGANVTAKKEVVYNELNPYVFGVVEWLLKNDSNKLIEEIEGVISEFDLNKGDKEQYLILRDYYNNVDNSPKYLYALHMYSFQNMIRYNNSQKFNTPIGVAGYSEDIKTRIKEFKVRAPKLTMLNLDYTDLDWDLYEKGTVFYFDPPYFITSAAYNDGRRGMKGWSADEEVELLNTLNYLNSIGHKFILSNVMHHRGKTNHLLEKWVEEHGYRVVDIGTSGWRYKKNEVLILNY